MSDLSQFRNSLGAWSPRNPESPLRGAAAEPVRERAGRLGRWGEVVQQSSRRRAPSRHRAPPTTPGFPAGSLRPALPATPPPHVACEPVCWAGAGAGAEWGVSSSLTSQGPCLCGHVAQDCTAPGPFLGGAGRGSPWRLLWSFLQAGKLAPRQEVPSALSNVVL